MPNILTKELEPVQWRPFWIDLNLNLAEMLSAIGLVQNSDQWKSILAARESTPDSNIDIEGYPYLRCTTLVKESEQTAALVFWQPWKVHGTTYEIDFRIRSITFSDHEISLNTSSDHFSKRLQVFIEERGDVHHFGLRVDRIWWERAHAQHPEVRSAVLGEKEGFSRNDIDLTMGHVPIRYVCRQYFADYLMPANSQDDDMDELKAQLAGNGWSAGVRNMYGYDGRAEPEHLIHKYMEIRHAYLR